MSSSWLLFGWSVSSVAPVIICFVVLFNQKKTQLKAGSIKHACSDDVRKSLERLVSSPATELCRPFTGDVRWLYRMWLYVALDDCIAVAAAERSKVRPSR